jgi:hypothetical protein
VGDFRWTDGCYTSDDHSLGGSQLVLQFFVSDFLASAGDLLA